MSMDAKPEKRKKKNLGKRGKEKGGRKLIQLRFSGKVFSGKKDGRTAGKKRGINRRRKN